MKWIKKHKKVCIIIAIVAVVVIAIIIGVVYGDCREAYTDGKCFGNRYFCGGR